MTGSVSDLTSVTIAVDEALQLLDAYAGDQLGGSMGESLPSLVEQCEILLSELQSQSEEAIRSLHHFACTGGTLISRCIAAMPNTVLLSEIDPLSSQYKKLGPNKFFPTDLTHYLGNNLRPPDEDMVIGMFLAGIDSLREQLSQGGRRLVLRDHSHSQYCCVEDSRSRPSLRSILSRRFQVRSCVTVRHPLDSYISLHANKVDHFQPFNLEEYSRRYMMFLDDYIDVEIVRFENVISDPDGALGRICTVLDLPFVPDTLNVLEMVVLSGDSGRPGNTIDARPRRQVSEPIAAEALTSTTYHRLCDRLDYTIEP